MPSYSYHSYFSQPQLVAPGSAPHLPRRLADPLYGDWCSADCSEEVAICGDGHLSPGEVCDDGDTDDTNTCSNSCTINILECGFPDYAADGYCDESNNTPVCNWDGGDCCESTCIDGAYTCGTVGFDCQNPAACENSGGC